MVHPLGDCAKAAKISMVKTSISNLLRIDEVQVANGSGIIGVTLCPGKKINSAMSGVWNRDLTNDLQAIQDCGPQRQMELESYGYQFLRINKFTLRPQIQGQTERDVLNQLLEESFN